MVFNYEFKFKRRDGNEFIDLPFPQETEGAFTWEMEEVCTDNTQRSEDVTMNKEVMLNGKKRALTVKYLKLPHSIYANLVKAIKGTGKGGTNEDIVYGTLIYPDVENWESCNSTREVYTGNLSATNLGYRDYDTGELLVSTQIKFIEV